MKYKTFSQWLEMAKPATTNPPGPAGGSNPVEDAKKQLANKAGQAAQAGQDPKKVAQQVIQDNLKKAAGSKNVGIKDVAKLADAAGELSGNMKKKMKK